MTRGVAGGGAAPDRACRWQRVGPGDRCLGAGSIRLASACPSQSSVLITCLWTPREDLGQPGLMPSIVSLIGKEF